MVEYNSLLKIVNLLFNEIYFNTFQVGFAKYELIEIEQNLDFFFFSFHIILFSYTIKDILLSEYIFKAENKYLLMT